MMKHLFYALIVILAASICGAETYVMDSGITVAPATEHQFVVNEIYTTPSLQGPEITARQIASEANISPCGMANLSFELENPGSQSIIYSFSMRNFKGTSYITPNLMLASGEKAIVNYALVPDCSLGGTINPIVKIETKDESADITSLIHISSGVNQSSCSYYYNETICNSEFYLRFNQDTTYYLDLSPWFFDPDGDNLTYSASPATDLRVKIQGDTADITPARNWQGAEEIVFYADDGKGGSAQSRKFYVHVLPDGKSFLQRLFSWL